MKLAKTRTKDLKERREMVGRFLDSCGMACDQETFDEASAEYNALGREIRMRELLVERNP